MKILILLILIMPFAMNSQDLKKHKWENRIIVIASPSFENREAALQLSYLSTNMDKLKERKLLVYHVTNTGYTFNFGQEIFPSSNNELEIIEFNTSLIGLDGTEKYHVTSPQPAAIFFNLIDSMPMRKAEINNE